MDNLKEKALELWDKVVDLFNNLADIAKDNEKLSELIDGNGINAAIIFVAVLICIILLIAIIAANHRDKKYEKRKMAEAEARLAADGNPKPVDLEAAMEEHARRGSEIIPSESGNDEPEVSESPETEYAQAEETEAEVVEEVAEEETQAEPLTEESAGDEEISNASAVEPVAEEQAAEPETAETEEEQAAEPEVEEPAAEEPAEPEQTEEPAAEETSSKSANIIMEKIELVRDTSAGKMSFNKSRSGREYTEEELMELIRE